ncbi:HNH endonuclease, partial [Actinosynnema sp.]|uniref:HNH endonuclease n=1 Tax=Actinosynnema sp. TaxID=1872144 RepID=UPI003F83A6D9
RDGGTCRTPWCDAPVRHVDHVVPHARGGRTDSANTAGLCVACNLVKESPGWRAAVGPPGRVHTITTTTPTGHTYDSQAPPLPGGPSRGRVRTVPVEEHQVQGPVEIALHRHLRAA